MRYKSILEPAERSFVERKSTFIGRATPAHTEEEANAFIAAIRESEPRATHHCACYRIGCDGRYQKADDHGEPHGTAGIPMLEVLKKENVTDTVVVVTRYFGGIKLGAAGLVRAYSKGCHDALTKAGIATFAPFALVSAQFSYAQKGRIDYDMAPYAALEPEYGAAVDAKYWIPVDDVDKVKNQLLNLTSGTLVWTIVEQRHLPVDQEGKPLEGRWEHVRTQ